MYLNVYLNAKVQEIPPPTHDHTNIKVVDKNKDVMGIIAQDISTLKTEFIGLGQFPSSWN